MGGFPGWLSMATTSKRRRQSSTLAFGKDALRRAHHYSRFSRVTLSSGSAVVSSSTVRVRTSTNASVLPS